jgi:hypothetical protein
MNINNESNDNNIDDINNQLEDFSKKISEHEFMEAYRQAEQLTLIPILKLIYETTKIDLSKDFKIKIPFSSNKSKEIPIGEIELNKLDNNNIKYKIYLDLVDTNYDLNQELINYNILSYDILQLSEEPNEALKSQLIQIITYLTQSAKLIFDGLKNKYTEIIEYNIEMDNNTTIYLDYNISKRLGVKIKKDN